MGRCVTFCVAVLFLVMVVTDSCMTLWGGLAFLLQLLVIASQVYSYPYPYP